MAPVLRDDELRLVTLTLIHERPREFTELRDALRTRLGGNYTVASSVLSRVLHDLERDGSVTLSHGATNLYATTLQGEAEVTARRDDATRVSGSGDTLRARATALRRDASAAKDALRTSLAARDETPSAPQAQRDLRYARGDLARRIEATTQRFRMQVRAAAREADNEGRLTPETVAQIEADILALQARVTEQLDRQ